MSEEDERIELSILGRKVGTYTGWDQQDTMSFTYYNVEPTTPIGLPSGDWDVDYDAGKISCGEQERDLIEAISGLLLA